MKPGLAATALLLGGCNLVFGLEPPGGPDLDGLAADAAMCGVHDEDGDTVPDGCDNCPHLANADQAHGGDSDPVGDACDPHPLLPVDRLVRFESFATAPPDMVTVSSTDTPAFQVRDDALIDGDDQLEVDELARFPVGRGRITIVTTYTIIDLTEPPKGQSAAVGIWGVIDGPSGVFPGGVLGEAGVDVGFQRVLVTQLADTASALNARGLSPRELSAGERLTATLTIGDTAFADFTVVDTSDGQMDQASLVTGALRGTEIGLRTHGVAVRFDYLVVFGRSDP